MKIADKAVRWFVGVLFIFSGLVKLNDPMGTAIKMEEYFEVFSNDISSLFHYLVPFALSVGLFVVILEVLLGVAVLINYRMKLTSWVLILLIVFFTFLTFYSAAFDKVTDCGCFGDAIAMNPWQSFFKDIILLFLTGFIFIRKKHYLPIFNNMTESVILGIVLAVNVFIAYVAIEHLPPIDFRPYKIGADIKASMQPTEDFRYKYVMEKDGEAVEFDYYPTDTSYKFVEMILLNPEAEPKITDYNVWNEEGDFTEETFTGVKLLVLFSDVNKSRVNKVAEINNLVAELGNDVEAWVITANDEATYENFRHEYQIALPYYYADGTVIKAMIR
ncbi:MAG: DoxX family membrane protein, partial [Cyclobacteriaceae bacterium]|nr:DoxX family membrane protein [Cyclobacteriaceae bacterium]